MTENTQEQKIEKKRKAKKIFLHILFLCSGLFLLGYGLIAMLFNFKAGLLISIAGCGILFFQLYHAYNPD